MPVEIYDIYLQELPPPPLLYKMHRVVMRDMIYRMCSMPNCNRPPGNGIVVIKSNFILKCHMFLGATKPLVIPVM